MTHFQRFAEIALTLIAQAGVKADDESLMAAQGTRAFLTAIVEGKLVVTELSTGAEK